MKTYVKGYPQEWDCKDDLKTFENDMISRFKVGLSALNIDFYWLTECLSKERNKFTVGYHKYKKTYHTVVSEVPSFMGNPVLYIFL